MIVVRIAVLVGLAAVAFIGLTALAGCTTYHDLQLRKDGKLYIAYQSGFNGGVLLCNHDEPADLLDCTPLRVKLPAPPPPVQTSGQPVRGTSASNAQITIDANNPSAAVPTLRGWVGMLLDVKISDGRVLTGALTRLDGALGSELLILDTAGRALAIRLSDTVSVTVTGLAPAK